LKKVAKAPAKPQPEKAPKKKELAPKVELKEIEEKLEEILK